jgi:very-short-patch-repair endonuclease
VGTTAAETPDGPLGALCSYYLDCLLQQDEKGVSTFAAGNHGVDYEELDAVPALTGDIEAPFSTDGGRRLVQKLRGDRGSKALYLGYPVRLRFHRSQKGWQGFFVEPIFLWLYQVEGPAQAFQFSLLDELPSFNFAAIRHLTEGYAGDSMADVLQLEEELGLNEKDAAPEVDDLVLALKEARPEWPWREEPEAEQLSQEPRLCDAKEDGIYNRSVLVLSERKPYTLGLEGELQKLKKVTAAELRDTALATWLGLREEELGTPEPLPSLLEPVPLNTEQREAVRQSLTRPLTVITGPPGTGKSQVVTDLLVNVAWRGERALFASKNNKAVDVVEARVNGLTRQPILIRTGTGAYQQRLVSYLNALMAAHAGAEDERRFSEEKGRHAELLKRIKKIDESRQRVIDTRNTVDRLEQQAEEARTLLGAELFKRSRALEVADLSDAGNFLAWSARRAIREDQSAVVRLLWFALRGKRQSELRRAAQRALGEADRLGMPSASRPRADAAPTDWETWGRSLRQFADACAKSRDYLKALQALTGERPLELLAADEMLTLDDFASVSRRLWDGWLSLQPQRLTALDRRTLGEFAAVLQLVIQADESGQRPAAEIWRRKEVLYPKVAKLLPCWAVTSLAARGRIPFQPSGFDLLVIDEASQCDIASALPLLYRAKRAAIIGDPQQLQHISALTLQQEQQLLVKHDLHTSHLAWGYSVNSLFNLASSLVAPGDVVGLRDHHRSHGDIVEFSNRQFYGGRLRVATKYETLRRPDKTAAVRWVNVQGKVVRPPEGGAINEGEVAAVVAELRKLVIEKRYEGTIGVVSPFRAQANRIREVVNADSLLSAALARAEFIADTVHKFQGDERDVMFFSPTVGDGISRGALGFLSRNGNLFNVAITRARGALIVVGDRASAISSGVDYLAEFCRYVAALGTEAAAKESRAELGPMFPTVARPDTVSDWEKILYGALYKAGIRPIPQYAVDQYVLDLALMAGDQRLDIEVDGERYHRGWDGELSLRDRLRNQRLIELGWDVMRFWVYQVRDDLGGCVERVAGWAKVACT